MMSMFPAATWSAEVDPGSAAVKDFWSHRMSTAYRDTFATEVPSSAMALRRSCCSMVRGLEEGSACTGPNTWSSFPGAMDSTRSIPAAASSADVGMGTWGKAAASPSGVPGFAACTANKKCTKASSAGGGGGGA